MVIALYISEGVKLLLYVICQRQINSDQQFHHSTLQCDDA